MEKKVRKREVRGKYVHCNKFTGENYEKKCGLRGKEGYEK